MNDDKLKKEVLKSAEVIRKGGVILYPTDTIWGLGCDARNKKAVDKIFLIKRRTAFKSLIILAESVERIAHYVNTDPELIRDLTEGFDKPTTIIYPGGRNVAKNVIASDGTVAVRLARHRFCEALIKELDHPIISTSANISGDPPPSLFSQISEEIKENVGYVVDWERYAMKDIKPSTVIKLRDDGMYDVLRP
jgi:L-threonylcarbamoyladenylate synthase